MSAMTLPANLDQLTADELRELVRQQAEVITHKDPITSTRTLSIGEFVGTNSERIELSAKLRAWKGMRPVGRDLVPARTGEQRLRCFLAKALDDSLYLAPGHAAYRPQQRRQVVVRLVEKGHRYA